MDSANPSNSSKPTRGKKTAAAAKPRRQTRKQAETQVFNVGQVHMLIDLMNEYSRHVEAPSLEADGDIEMTLTSDMPGLEDFVQFKLAELKRHQDVFESLWNL